MLEVAFKITDEFLDVIDIVERAFIIEVDDAFIACIRAYAEAPITGLSTDAQKYAERGAHQLASTLGAYDKAKDKPLWRDYLDASYAELFLGVTPHATEPVESCYMNDERILYAKQYFEVKEAMDKHGFAVPGNFLEPADHIAMEWAFFAYLLKQGGASVDAAMKFKQEHMDMWMERAFAAIVNKDDMGFYTGIANLARAVMREVRG
jgi:TorA maturation chaperone TorD